MGEIVKETEIQWMKPDLNENCCILGKDVAVVASNSLISFIETTRPEKKELIYNANSEVRGDGVQCLTTHKTLSCFAFAEMCRNPRILIVSYPNFEVFKSFESATDTNYIALKFTEMEYLVALTGIPDYKIVVWNWRTAEKVYSQETRLKHPVQSLSISTTSPIQILQSTSSDRDVLRWDMSVCYKKIIFNKSNQRLPDESLPPYCFCYGGDGELYCLDSNGSLYLISSDGRGATVQLSWKKTATEGYSPSLAWYKGGLALVEPGEVQFWKRKSPEGWTMIWSLSTKMNFAKLLSSSLKDHLIGITRWNEVAVFKGESQIDCVTVRNIGSDFEFVCLVHPVGEYFLTYGNSKKCFTIWNKANGQKASQMNWTKKKINFVASSPRRPFAAAATEDGKVSIINVYDPNYLMELDEVALTRNSLSAIRFAAQGTMFSIANVEIGEFFLVKLPAKLDVVAYTKIDLKIVDYALHENEENKLYLLVVPMSQICCRSGHNLMIYAFVEKLKIFEYVKDIVMPWIATSITPSSVTPNELFCIPHRSRQVGLINLKTGKIVHKFVSGHQMKIISMKCERDYLLTYGADGIVIVNSIPNRRCVSVFAAHHRLAKGVKNIVLDPFTKYILTLGENGSLVCSVFKKLGNTDAKQEYESMLATPHFKQIFLNPILSEKAKAKALEKFLLQNPEQARDVLGDAVQKTRAWDKVWLEMRKEESVALEEQRSRKERLSVIEEFEALKKKLRQLLDENYENPPERQLPVQTFDLDKATRRKKLEDGKNEREKERQIQMALMKNLNKITDVIKKVCWDSVWVKGRELHGVLSPMVVQSYSLLPDAFPPKLKMNWLADRLQIEAFFHMGDFFEPWVPRDSHALEQHLNEKFQVSSVDITQTIKTKFKEEQLDDERNKMDVEDERQKLVWTGTSSHNFIQVDPNHYSQFELTTFFQGHQEIRMIEMDIKKLMLWFNKEFKETFAQKEQEMAFLYDRNDRFRHIINELSFFHFSPHICRTQIYDPEWAPEENPETIMTVDDKEVSVLKYLSESETELIKMKKQEEEKLRQMLLADDFKEKALVAMMDGVLEKLWEDEIKKDAVKPKCMVEKDPESWTEDDLKAVKAYEEAVKVLLIERERYRKILEERWAKTIVTVRDSVTKFDEKIMKLHFLKLKVESAIGQETLKSLRIRQRCFQRIEMDRREENIKSCLLKNEKKIESMTSELNRLVEMHNECKNYFETLQNKDKNLDKNFKREFPEYSPIICEQLYKLSKKRPKLMQKAAIYSTVLNDTGKCVVTGSKPEYLPTECIQYLKDVDSLDVQSNAPASVSQQSWELACKLRRAKIDTELKVRACAIDLADAEATVSAYQKALKAAKDHQGQLQNDLQNLRGEKLNSSINSHVQLVMRKGLVEVPLSGQISDFNESILVTKDTLVQVNKAIQKMGLQKIKAMQKAENFRKGIIYKEWEHKKLRMEIEDLKSRLDTVEKLQVLKELQAILVARARGFPEEKGFLYMENELSKVKEKFQKIHTDIFKKIDELDLKIQKISYKNQDLNDRIEELNIEVNELNLGRDKDFDAKHHEENLKKLKKIRERGKLVRKIQEQHKEILILQTELELLRLKTYPTIKHKAP